MTGAFLHGISPVLPVLLVLILVLISILSGWWSYKDLTDQPITIRATLITLRSLTLLILCFLLLNPYLIREETETVQVEIPIFIDNSASVEVERGSYGGVSDFESMFDLIAEYRDDLDQDYVAFTEYLFGDGVRESGSPDFTDPSTNIQEVMEFLLENENRAAAAILFTDGIYTRGRNPVYEAQNLSIPLIVFPLGDSSSVRDISIAEVEFNDPLYTNTSNRITAEIQHRGFEGMETEVTLIEDGAPVETKTILFPSSSGTEWVDFDRIYRDEGFVNITIEADPLEGEFTRENNRYNSAIRVLDDKTVIASVAFEIHPDVSSIRRFISSDPQYDLYQTTVLGGNRFTGSPLSGINPDEIDLLVVHGLPQVNNSELIRLLNSDLSVLYFSLPQSYGSPAEMGRSNPALYEINGSFNTVSVLPAKDTLQISNPVLESLPSILNRFPVLNTVQARYRPSPGANILMWGQFERRQTNIPLLLSSDYGNKRIISVNAYGWNRYELAANDESRLFYQALLENLLSWTSTPADNRLLVLQPLSTRFTEREQIQVRATLTNERGEREPNASVNITLSRLDRDMSPLSFQMRHIQNGIYELEAGRYPSGIYSLEGVALAGNREIGRDQNQFTISSVNEELVNTRRNDALLNQLATLTGGFVADSAGLQRLESFMDEITAGKSVEDTISVTDYLYRDSWWFILVLLLLTGEWLLRRRISLP
jgi:hypothetical protein